MEFEFHPLANLFPLIEDRLLDELAADIKANGLHDPIDIYQGKILDGRNRYLACKAAGVELHAAHLRYFRTELCGDPFTYIISKNVRRRHLTTGQRAYAIAEYETYRHGGARTSQSTGPTQEQDANLQLDQTPAPARAELADAANVSERSIASAAVVRDRGVPELKEAVKQGELSISSAEQIARLPEKEQPAAVAKAVPAGARSIMSSRQEPDDSLDFFPTPPWATRALIKHALRRLGMREADLSRQSFWEPACGEGHMAEVLQEYFGAGLATDIHDYGYGERHDFLAQTGTEGGGGTPADWIITNPPFNDKTEAFVLRALDLATIGVAMFVRMQWLETIGRYERLFRDRPPTLIAFFCERVNLCKGRWEPDGSTATAYIWLVWIKGASPRAPFWIPPGCREHLTNPDDADRFTAHPVVRRQIPQVDCRVCADGTGICAQCIAAADHQLAAVRLGTDWSDLERPPLTVCSCGWRGEPQEIKQHWRAIVAEAKAAAASTDELPDQVPDFLHRRVRAEAAE